LELRVSGAAVLELVVAATEEDSEVEQEEVNSDIVTRLFNDQE
jgi:hypothetical protein